jgi:glucose-1-phosphatase
MTIRAIIFDMGGVIVRTEDPTPRAQLAESISGLSFDQLESLIFDGPSALQATLGQIKAEQHWQIVLTALHLPAEKIPTIQNAFWGGDQVDYELVDFIRSLRKQYRVALLSNAWSDIRQILEQEWQVADAFDELIISAEVGLAKPDPRIYQHALQRLHVRPDETVFIDDFPENVAGALAEGLHAIQFRNPDQMRTDLAQILENN